MEFIPKHESLEYIRSLENIPDPPKSTNPNDIKAWAYFDKHVSKPATKQKSKPLGKQIKSMHGHMCASYEFKHGLTPGSAKIDRIMYLNLMKSLNRKDG